MMEKELIILQGETSTGKTQWAQEWQAADPTDRAVAYSLQSALFWLNRGYNVALELPPSRGLNNAAISSRWFGEH